MILAQISHEADLNQYIYRRKTVVHCNIQLIFQLDFYCSWNLLPFVDFDDVLQDARAWNLTPCLESCQNEQSMEWKWSYYQNYVVVEDFEDAVCCPCSGTEKEVIRPQFACPQRNLKCQYLKACNWYDVMREKTNTLDFSADIDRAYIEDTFMYKNVLKTSRDTNNIYLRRFYFDSRFSCSGNRRKHVAKENEFKTINMFKHLHHILFIPHQLNINSSDDQRNTFEIHEKIFLITFCEFISFIVCVFMLVSETSYFKKKTVPLKHLYDSDSCDESFAKGFNNRTKCDHYKLSERNRWILFNDFQIPNVVSCFPASRKNVITEENQCMKSEGSRLASFSVFPSDSGPSFIRLAQSGFYYTGKDNIIQCFSCGVENTDWPEGLSVNETHIKISPDCEFMCNQDDSNVPMYEYLKVGNKPSDKSGHVLNRNNADVISTQRNSKKDDIPRDNINKETNDAVHQITNNETITDLSELGACGGPCDNTNNGLTQLDYADTQYNNEYIIMRSESQNTIAKSQNVSDSAGFQLGSHDLVDKTRSPGNLSKNNRADITVCWDGAKHPRYAIEEERMKSFDKWAYSDIVTPTALVECGLFYAGKNHRFKNSGFPIKLQVN